MENENRRVYAADWFMRAASIPCGLIFAVFFGSQPPGSTTEFLVSFLAVFAGPVVIAGGWGAVLGADILDPEVTRGDWQAVLRGVAVAGASFLTYIFVICFWSSCFSHNAHGEFFSLFILLFVCGTIFVGWLVVPVGALAGSLLYKKQGKPD